MIVCTETINRNSLNAIVRMSRMGSLWELPDSTVLKYFTIHARGGPSNTPFSSEIGRVSISETIVFFQSWQIISHFVAGMKSNSYDRSFTASCIASASRGRKLSAKPTGAAEAPVHLRKSRREILDRNAICHLRIL